MGLAAREAPQVEAPEERTSHASIRLRHAPGIPSLTVSVVTDRQAVLEMEHEWNALVESTGKEPFYRHEYFRSWLESFAPEAGLRLLAGRDNEGRLVALLPLIERSGRVLGIPVREWSSPTNVHSFRFDLLAEDPAVAAPALLDCLAAQRRWSMLRVTDVPANGSAWHLYRSASDAGWPAGVYESQRSPYIALPATFEDLARAWSSRFRSNLRRRRRLLEQRGAVSVERVEGGPHLQAILDECFQLESRGWKGRRGEPADGDPRIRAFYSALAERTSTDNSFSLFLLRLDGKLIAFHYGLTRHGSYSLLMTSYDEALRECSPGHLLVEEVLKDCFAAGVREFDFLGCDLEWKRAWTKSCRSHSWLFLFRKSPLGRTLRRAKFDWAPNARRLLGSPRRQDPAPVSAPPPLRT